MFLIRDAPNDYGFESGDRMVDALLKKGLLEDPQAGEDIRACFDKVRGFNMPHPGEEIGRGFRGAGASYHAIVQGHERIPYLGLLCLCTYSAMSPSFKQYVKEFVETLLSPGSLPVKKVNGKTLTCGGLLHLFKVRVLATILAENVVSNVLNCEIPSVLLIFPKTRRGLLVTLLVKFLVPPSSTSPSLDFPSARTIFAITTHFRNIRRRSSQESFRNRPLSQK